MPGAAPRMTRATLAPMTGKIEAYDHLPETARAIREQVFIRERDWRPEFDEWDAVAVHLLAGITAGERMEWLVEKATELGVASITPLEAERSVMRLKGDRATKRQERWQAIAASACEQCGRNQVPIIHAPVDLAQWSRADALAGAQRLVLSLAEGTQPLTVALQARAATQPVVFLSGPEGGLSPAEEALARAHGFAPVTLGARVLRAETAPLAALAYLAAL